MTQPIEPSTAVETGVEAIIKKVEEGAAQLRANVLNELLSGFETRLKEAVKPNLDTVRAISDDNPKPRDTSRVTITPAEDQRYRMLSAEDRKFRTPATDHYIAEYVRSCVLRDMPAAMRARDKADELARADLLEGTTTAHSGLSQGTGADLLPLPFSMNIVRARDKQAKIRKLATIYTSDSLTLRVPTTTVATAAMAAEGGVAAQGEPTIAFKLFAKKKMQANFEMSNEMIRDSAFNLVTFLSERTGSAFGALEDVEICVASGTPTVSTALSSISETAEGTPATLNYADVVALFFALPEQYQQNSVWLADSVALQLLSSIRATGGWPIFNQLGNPGNVVGDATVVSGLVGTVFGRPIYNVPLASGSLFVADMSFYGILDGGGITMRSSDAALWSADSTAIRFTTSFDGNVMLAAAFRKTIGLTTAGT